MKKINLHTHTTFCDGKNSAEEMALAAIAQGFDVFGFSGHSYTPFDESYCMSLEGTEAYRREIARLRAKYEGHISLLCGVEQDYYSSQPTDGYDYVIGSVHAFYNEKFDKYIYVDYGAEKLIEAAERFYDGDFLAVAEDYFDRISHVYQKTRCNIIGHFDLLTKFNEQHPMFDESHPRYVQAVDNALNVLLPTGAIFEINTGAMSKGYRTTPYPSESILRKIRMGGGKIIISADTHAVNTVDFAFDDAVRLSQICGFESIVSLSPEGKFFEAPL